MTDSTSPDVPTREPTPQTGQPPAALSRRGILSARECVADKPVNDGDRLDVGGALWFWFKRDLTARYYRQPTEG